MPPNEVNPPQELIPPASARATRALARALMGRPSRFSPERLTAPGAIGSLGSAAESLGQSLIARSQFSQRFGLSDWLSDLLSRYQFGAWAFDTPNLHYLRWLRGAPTEASETDFGSFATAYTSNPKSPAPVGTSIYSHQERPSSFSVPDLAFARPARPRDAISQSDVPGPLPTHRYVQQRAPLLPGTLAALQPLPTVLQLHRSNAQASLANRPDPAPLRSAFPELMAEAVARRSETPSRRGTRTTPEREQIELPMALSYPPLPLASWLGVAASAPEQADRESTPSFARPVFSPAASHLLALPQLSAEPLSQPVFERPAHLAFAALPKMAATSASRDAAYSASEAFLATRNAATLSVRPSLERRSPAAPVGMRSTSPVAPSTAVEAPPESSEAHPAASRKSPLRAASSALAVVQRLAAIALPTVANIVTWLSRDETGSHSGEKPSRQLAALPSSNTALPSFSAIRYGATTVVRFPALGRETSSSWLSLPRARRATQADPAGDGGSPETSRLNLQERLVSKQQRLLDTLLPAQVNEWSSPATLMHRLIPAQSAQTTPSNRPAETRYSLQPHKSFVLSRDRSFRAGEQTRRDFAVSEPLRTAVSPVTNDSRNIPNLSKRFEAIASDPGVREYPTSAFLNTPQMFGLPLARRRREQDAPDHQKQVDTGVAFRTLSPLPIMSWFSHKTDAAPLSGVSQDRVQENKRQALSFATTVFARVQTLIGTGTLPPVLPPTERVALSNRPAYSGVPTSIPRLDLPRSRRAAARIESADEGAASVPSRAADIQAGRSSFGAGRLLERLLSVTLSGRDIGRPQEAFVSSRTEPFTASFVPRRQQTSATQSTATSAAASPALSLPDRLATRRRRLIETILPIWPSERFDQGPTLTWGSPSLPRAAQPWEQMRQAEEGASVGTFETGPSPIYARLRTQGPSTERPRTKDPKQGDEPRGMTRPARAAFAEMLTGTRSVFPRIPHLARIFGSAVPIIDGTGATQTAASTHRQSVGLPFVQRRQRQDPLTDRQITSSTSAVLPSRPAPAALSDGPTLETWAVPRLITALLSRYQFSSASIRSVVGDNFPILGNAFAQVVHGLLPSRDITALSNDGHHQAGVANSGLETAAERPSVAARPVMFTAYNDVLGPLLTLPARRMLPHQAVRDAGPSFKGNVPPSAGVISAGTTSSLSQNSAGWLKKPIAGSLTGFERDSEHILPPLSLNSPTVQGFFSRWLRMSPLTATSSFEGSNRDLFLPTRAPRLPVKLDGSASAERFTIASKSAELARETAQRTSLSIAGDEQPRSSLPVLRGLGIHPMDRLPSLDGLRLRMLTSSQQAAGNILTTIRRPGRKAESVIETGNSFDVSTFSEAISEIVSRTLRTQLLSPIHELLVATLSRLTLPADGPTGLRPAEDQSTQSSLLQFRPLVGADLSWVRRLTGDNKAPVAGEDVPSYPELSLPSLTQFQPPNEMETSLLGQQRRLAQMGPSLMSLMQRVSADVFGPRLSTQTRLGEAMVSGADTAQKAGSALATAQLVTRPDQVLSSRLGAGPTLARSAEKDVTSSSPRVSTDLPLLQPLDAILAWSSRLVPRNTDASRITRHERDSEHHRDVASLSRAIGLLPVRGGIPPVAGHGIETGRGGGRTAGIIAVRPLEMPLPMRTAAADVDSVASYRDPLLIQRAAIGSGATSSGRGSASAPQAQSGSAPTDDGGGQDVDEIAKEVYAQIRRRLSLEAARAGHR